MWGYFLDVSWNTQRLFEPNQSASKMRIILWRICFFAGPLAKWTSKHLSSWCRGSLWRFDSPGGESFNLSIYSSIGPFVCSRIFRSCHPYVRLIRSFPGFPLVNDLKLVASLFHNLLGVYLQSTASVGEERRGGGGSNCSGYGIYIIFSMIYMLIRVEIRLCMCVYIWISIVNTSTTEINYASEIPRQCSVFSI